MLKTRNWMTNTVMIAGLLVSGAAYAASPVTLSDAQMDAVTAGGVTKVGGFVCPVITTNGVLNSPKGIMIGEGHYSISGPDHLMVPVQATNNGTPPGPHSQPGDRDYTAIWNKTLL